MLFPALCFLLSAGEAQEVSISINTEIDSLHARLLRSPTDRSLQLKLIDAYILSFNPELAFLEILNAENAADAKVRGLTQMSLEQVEPALRSLQQAYLGSPSDETLLLISLLYYARGDTQRGSSLLQQLRSHNPHLSIDLLKLYERFYLNGRKRIGSSAALALRDTDPAAYQSYFPQPAISILSPSADFTTEAAQTSVIFEVHHTRPVQSVALQGKTVYERANEKIVSAEEAYHQSFSQLVQLHEGENLVVVQATDVFGNAGSDTVTVNGLNFDRPAAWTSPASDSLRRTFQYFRNYVPDSALVPEKSNSYRTLIVGGKPPRDSSVLDGCGLFLYELMTHPISGITQSSNAKLLLKNRMKSRNISLIVKDWLLKGATFQSVSVVYLGGEWRISDQVWDLYDSNGEVIDMKPLLEQLKSVATAGVVLFFDGTIDKRDLLVQDVRRIVQTSAVPMEVFVFPSGGDWVFRVLAAMSNSGSRVWQDSLAPFFSTRFLEQILPGSIAVNARVQSINVAQNPARIIQQRHQRMFNLLQQRLSTEKVPAGTKSKILDFCKDWRRYHEMARFLSYDLTLNDLIIRVDEYRSRATDAGRN